MIIFILYERLKMLEFFISFTYT